MKHDSKKEFMDAYEKYADAIYRHCFFRVYSKGKAEELVQETFMKAWQYLAEGKKVDNMKAFLYHIATNLIIDESRKKKEESLDVLLAISDAFEPSLDGRRVIEQSALMHEIRTVIEKLPQEYKEVVIMRYIDDLDPREIAEALGISANNVSVRLHRALVIIQKLFHK